MSPVRMRLLLAWVGATAAAIASLHAQGGPPPGFFAPKALSLAGRADVPMALIGDTRATVLVMINGRGPYRLAIETGAPFIMLFPEVVTQLQLTTPANAPGPNARHVDSITVGALTLRDVNIFAARDALLPGVDGLMGLGAYRDLLITVDYPARRVSFERGQLPAVDGRTVFDAVPMGPFFGVALTVTGRRVNATIDTQGATFVSCSPAVADSLLLASAPVRSGTATVGVTDVEVRTAALAGTIRLGRYLVDRPLLDIARHPPGYPDQCLVGIDFLKHFAITLDQQAGRVRFVRADSLVPPGH